MNVLFVAWMTGTVVGTVLCYLAFRRGERRAVAGEGDAPSRYHLLYTSAESLGLSIPLCLVLVALVMWPVIVFWAVRGLIRRTATGGKW